MCLLALGDVCQGEREEGGVGRQHVRNAGVVCDERGDDAAIATSVHDRDFGDELTNHEEQEGEREHEEQRDERDVRAQRGDAMRINLD